MFLINCVIILAASQLSTKTILLSDLNISNGISFLFENIPKFKTWLIFEIKMEWKYL